MVRISIAICLAFTLGLGLGATGSWIQSKNNPKTEKPKEVTAKWLLEKTKECDYNRIVTWNSKAHERYNFCKKVGGVWSCIDDDQLKKLSWLVLKDNVVCWYTDIP